MLINISTKSICMLVIKLQKYTYSCLIFQGLLGCYSEFENCLRYKSFIGKEMQPQKYSRAQKL